MRSCKNPKVTPPPKPKKKMGRPRLSVDLTHWTGRGRGIRGGGRGNRGGKGGRSQTVHESQPFPESQTIPPFPESQIIHEIQGRTSQYDDGESAGVEQEFDHGDESDDNADIDILGVVMDMKNSGYIDEDIMDTIAITESELQHYVGLLQKVCHVLYV